VNKGRVFLATLYLPVMVDKDLCNVQ